MIVQILTSLITQGIAIENIVVLTFSPLAAPIMIEFFLSQGPGCRVEHVGSANIKAKELLIAIVDLAATSHDGNDLDDALFSAARIIPTLMIPRALRVVAGHTNFIDCFARGGRQYDDKVLAAQSKKSKKSKKAKKRTSLPRDECCALEFTNECAWLRLQLRSESRPTNVWQFWTIEGNLKLRLVAG
ncbi:unnamed protein product [Diplocarpon coronariae]|nr:hypothetical protein JHW43_002436 [Diplocarpon mali]